eukprot:GILI01007562.1.p1 GENE.GILI01007562.1~~GILI01007562.1.p1  ORF type:complete len:350 (-),score=98.03 GILI01007562.1:115-1164(-)
MFRGYPAIKVAGPAEDIDVKFQETDASGCVLARNMNEIASVEVDLQVALRIAKHAGEMQKTVDFGDVFGVQLGSTIEISQALPRLTPNVRRVSADEHAKAIKEAEAIVERASRTYKSIMSNNFLDANRVGFYTISDPFRLYQEKNIKSLEALVDANSPAVMLVHDKSRTKRGRLHLRAFVLTNAYITFHRQRHNEASKQINEVQLRRKMRVCGVYEQGVLREVPVSIRCSLEQQLLLADSVATPELPRMADNIDQRIQYGTALLQNYSRGIHNFNKSLNSHTYGVNRKLRERDYQRDSGNTVVMDIEEKDVNNVDINTLLGLASLTEQAEHIQAVCDSVLMNLAVAKKL